jgi:hypothetical protein
MLAYVKARKRTPERGGGPEYSMPFDIRRRLHEWVDVDEVGAEGFWIWLRAAVPLLPRPGTASERADRVRSVPDELLELRRRVMFYAREHARLSVISGQCTRDNQTLSRRLRALESALKTLEGAGHPVEIPPDENATDAAQRYLPVRTRPPWRREPPVRAQ